MLGMNKRMGQVWIPSSAISNEFLKSVIQTIENKSMNKDIATDENMTL